MFRCEFSGELSKPAEWGWTWQTETDKQGHVYRTNLVKRVTTQAEAPIRVVVAEREMKYFNEKGQLVGTGREIAKTLLIRAKHFDAVKEKYGPVVRQI